MHHPWLAHYPKEVPHRVSHEPLTLGELLPAAIRRWPDRTALVLAVHAAHHVFTRSLRYRELGEQVERLAGALQRLGVSQGDRVALYLPNCPQFVVGYLAAARLGAICVPFNVLYSAREAEHQLADCGAKVALVLAPFVPLIQKAQPRTSLTHIIATRIQEHFPLPLRLLYAVGPGRKEPKVCLGASDHWLQDVLAWKASAPEAPRPDEGETAVLLYTGGTTGVSKGVELSHRNLIINAEQNRAWASIAPGAEVTLAALPLFHAFGLTCSLNLGMLTGATLVLVPNPRDVKGLAAMIRTLQPTVFPVVPTLLVGLTGVPGLRREDCASVRVCPCAGSPLAPAVQRAFIERTGIHACEGYGLTEAAPVVMGNPPFGDDRHGTVGLPYPDTEVRVVDPDTGVPLPFVGEWTEPGELWVRGPQVMKGYWGRPEATAEQLVQGWLRTGDLGQMHRDGYFRVVDRLKDLIIRSGMKIFPAEVEALLLDHPKVLHALVLGVPDEMRGERVKAFVVPRPGAVLGPEELFAFCGDKLAKYKIPSEIEVRAELPLSAVGKPMRRLLREELALLKKAS